MPWQWARWRCSFTSRTDRMDLELLLEDFTKYYLTPYMMARIKEPATMSFYSDWAAAQDGSLDPVSGKPAVIHGKDVSPVHGDDTHNVHATNHPQNRTAVTSEPAAPKPVAKKRNRWGGGGDE